MTRVQCQDSPASLMTTSTGTRRRSGRVRATALLCDDHHNPERFDITISFPVFELSIVVVAAISKRVCCDVCLSCAYK